METQNHSLKTLTDAAFANTHVINSAVTMELLWKKIAKLSATIEHGQATTHRVDRLKSMPARRSTLHRCQQVPRSHAIAAIQAAFNEYGLEQK